MLFDEDAHDRFVAVHLRVGTYDRSALTPAIDTDKNAIPFARMRFIFDSYTASRRPVLSPTLSWCMSYLSRIVNNRLPVGMVLVG